MARSRNREDSQLIFGILAPVRWKFACCLIFLFALIALFARLPLHGEAVYADGGAGDAGHGQELFNRKCAKCHGIDDNKEGPRLRGVFGRKSASVQDFKYSDALQKANITWDADSLDKWLADPDKLVPDNDMDIRLEKAADRNDVIAYLKQVSGN